VGAGEHGGGALAGRQLGAGWASTAPNPPSARSGGGTGGWGGPSGQVGRRRAERYRVAPVHRGGQPDTTWTSAGSCHRPNSVLPPS